MKNILLFIHQLPQNLLGLVVLLFNIKSCEKNSLEGIQYYTVKHLANAGISLGNFIILDSDRKVTRTTVMHEHGHQLQSIRLGWLYLLVIGLPSFTGNIYSRIAKKDSKWYYNQPWEKWADKLGNVKRF